MLIGRALRADGVLERCNDVENEGYLPMDDETPEMEAISSEMREVMRAWIANPNDETLKARYRALQAAYQRAFLELKQRQRAAAEQE